MARSKARVGTRRESPDEKRPYAAVGEVLVPQLGPEAGRPRRVPPYLELTTDILLEVLVDAVIGLVPQAEVGDGQERGSAGKPAVPKT